MNIRHRNNVHILGDHGPVILYAHGFGCNQKMWDLITPSFANTHRQILFDYVGSGRSDLAAFDHQRYSTLDGYAQDIIDICDDLALREDVTLVAHSVSASIGLLASIARPGLFSRQVLVGPTPCFLNHPPEYLGGFEKDELQDLLALMDQNYIGWTHYLTPILSGQATGLVDAEPVTQKLSDSFCSTDPVAARIFAHATFFADNRADLPRVKCPCLIIQHRNDALVPTEVGQYLHAQLRDSTLKVLDIAGHCGHMSHPTLIVETMQAYFAESSAVT